MKLRLANWFIVGVGVTFIVAAAMVLSSYWPRRTLLEHGVGGRSVVLSSLLAAIGLWCLLGGIRNIRRRAIVARPSRMLTRLVIGDIAALLILVAGEYILFLLVPNEGLLFGLFAVIFHYGILLSLLLALILSVAWFFRRKESAA